MLDYRTMSPLGTATERHQKDEAKAKPPANQTPQPPAEDCRNPVACALKKSIDAIERKPSLQPSR